MTVVRRIQPLPEVVINQIAAGEVVERPASVVKELVENSLDAGASAIEVDIEGAGVHLVRVRDDGWGIPVEELPLALRRHCTSKITALEDLDAIATLGFRGEALPSIAAVARLTLTSRAVASDRAWRIEAEGAHASAPVPAAHPFGTTVEVRDLFVHVPARRRFLRSPRTESLHVQEALRRAALARFDLRLHATLEGRSFLRLPAARTEAERLRRVAVVLGTSFVETALPLEQADGPLAVEGWLGAPDAARASTDLQFIYLNGRAIRDPRLSHALRRAYEEWLPPGRFPACVLHLRIDPRTVDVNVHPAKAEVRFIDARTVHDFLHGAVRRVLRGASVPAAPVPETAAPAAAAAPDGTARGAAGSAWALYRAAEPAAAAPAGPRLHALLEGRYALCTEGEEALLLDVPALARELARRRWQAALEARGGLAARPLLLPEATPATGPAVQAAERAAEALRRLGLDLSPGGPGQLVLRGLPESLVQAEPAQVLRALLARLAAGDASEQGLVEAALESLGQGPVSLEQARAVLVACAQWPALLVPPLALRLSAGRLAEWLGRGGNP